MGTFAQWETPSRGAFLRVKLCAETSFAFVFFSYISHCRYARWKRTYQAGIYFQGVGVHLVGNEISWAPHTGINGIGNECLFEENYLHDLCYEVRDSGAFYVGRSWSERGNIVRNNAFENIVLSPETVHGTNEVSAIYLDDQISGWQITNNTFANCFQGRVVVNVLTTCQVGYTLGVSASLSHLNG